MNASIWKATLMLLILLFMASCTRCGDAPVSQDFILVYTASIIGELEPCG